MQLNHIKIKSKEMKNVGFRMMVTLSCKRQMDRKGEKEPFDWKQVTVTVLTFGSGNEFTTK